jgi:hypothetical protein
MAANRNASATPIDQDSELVAELRLMRAQLAGLAEENAILRSAVSRATGRDPEPVVQQQRTVAVPGMGYEHDPKHAPEVVAAIMRGEDFRPALEAARRRISEEITEQTGQPPRVGDYDLADKRRTASHEQRRGMAEAQRNLDLTDLPVEPGAVMTRNAETGQVTVKRPAGLTCPGGHPAEYQGQKFCTTCGGPMSAPALGEDWGTPSRQEAMRQERLRDEGII